MTILTASFAGHTVFRVGYGALQLERLHQRRGEAVALLRRAVELGVNHVDTAEFYGSGFANDVIRETLRPEDGVLVVTKVGADPNPGGRLPLRLAQRPEQLRASVPGTADAAHLEANIAASKITFDAATLATLDAIESRTNEVPIG